MLLKGKIWYIRINMFRRVFKVAILMNKVKRLDINQLLNNKTSKKLVKMTRIFQVTPNSKTRCKKRNSKVTTSLVNLCGANTTKPNNQLQLLPKFRSKKTRT